MPREKRKLFEKSGPLAEAYEKVHGREPERLKEWEMAEEILEVLDDPGWIPPDLAKECLYRIVHIIDYPDYETKRKIIWEAESRAKNIFPSDINSDEAHMEEIDRAYRKWKGENE